ncbi:unnamed protein product [Polarella glacialis]|uniref:Fatty acid desaturase domain-containing protein n=1 Tax=Polarella glacialis TaxID=89957 RepID=A0A813KWH2_POLGL|nr:unnamed protein product [Polarella glacialis]
MTWSVIAALGCAITVFLNGLVPVLAARSLWQGRRSVVWWRVVGMSLALSHVGISIGFHRYFSHGSFQTSAAGKWALATIGTLTMQGSPLYWAARHRLHHEHCEDPADPHSPTHGFLHAHGGFLTGLTGPTIDSHKEWSMRVVGDLAQDPDLAGLVRGPWAVAHPLGVMLGVPILSLAAFGGHATLWYLHVPQLLAWHATLSVNSATHTFGYPRGQADLRLPTPCRARNVPWLFGVLLGEAWHTNHHASPHIHGRGLVGAGPAISPAAAGRSGRNSLGGAF